MSSLALPRFTKRYKVVTDEKAGGATYTPTILADFVAQQMVRFAGGTLRAHSLRILDPATGDGELLISLLSALGRTNGVEVCGFETDIRALDRAQTRIERAFPNVSANLQEGNFLEYVLCNFGGRVAPSLFQSDMPEGFDLIIANPPYVRTQIMGAPQAQMLARYFGLTGRADLYYAFLMAMARVLNPQGVVGVIVSNRFMTTKSGAAVRAAVRANFNLRHVWDLGDTKIFDAAVLPAVLVAEGKGGSTISLPSFSSIYETDAPPTHEASDPIGALTREGVSALPDGRRFQVRHGSLEIRGAPDSVWRIETKSGSDWLATVAAHTWASFRDIGKIRVGVKTCADKIFIRHDWEALPENEQPELLRALTTHHVARRFRALRSEKDRRILYPHETVRSERRPVDLARYPRSAAYLERHREALEARKYVIEARRKWFEIWVPQDPAAWGLPKLVFRDISAEPVFWIDNDGTVVNGDCYWIAAERAGAEDLLWLAAAVANSTFAESFYDRRFNNKLYAGRRRFITQYVEQFPLPSPTSTMGRSIIGAAKEIYRLVDDSRAVDLGRHLNRLVWEAFGLVEEVGR
jgi:tRNA1(Val) A37 N6-methylase TrmN6